MGFPQHSPSAIGSWPVQRDLIDVHIRRATSTTQNLVAGIALRNLVRASLETPSQKPCGKKWHGEKSMHTALAYTCANF